MELNLKAHDPNLAPARSSEKEILLTKNAHEAPDMSTGITKRNVMKVSDAVRTTIRDQSNFCRRYRSVAMTSRLLAFAVVGATALPNIGNAADMALSGHSGPKRKPDVEIVDVYVPPPPPPKWTGFYGGINLGAGWGASSYSWNTWYEDGLYGGVSNNLRYGSGISLGIVGGAQAGYNFEIPGMKVAGKGFLAGFETDFQGTTMGGNSTQSGWLVNVNNSGTSFIPTQVNGPLYVTGFGTARGRFGVLLAPTFLVYGTGGFAYAGLSRSGAGFNFATVQTGWTAGGGMEFLLSPSLSMKMEYLYTNVGGKLPRYLNNYGPAVYPVGNNSAWNSVRLGLNYHLNFNPFPFILNVNIGQNEPPPAPKSSPVISSKY
jgi:outer membrane immunogenic protein